jgi:hypothetical protein
VAAAVERALAAMRRPAFKLTCDLAHRGKHRARAREVCRCSEQCLSLRVRVFLCELRIHEFNVRIALVES